MKIHQAPPNRYLYYLTPQGFAGKSRLTAEYLSVSFDFYRRAAASCAEAISRCGADGRAVLGLYGASDLAEIAALNIREAPPLNTWLFTVVEGGEQLYAELVRRVGAQRVLATSILRLSP